MNRTAAALFLLTGSVLSAQDEPAPAPGPQVTLSSSYALSAQEVPGSAWTASQSATLALAGRWGQALKLEGQVYAPFDDSALTADNLVSQLALTWDVNAWSVVTFGKQRLKWGTAKVFSAVDNLEPAYDPLHPAAVLNGVTGVKFELLPNEWLGVSVLALPAATLEDSKLAARADVLWDDWDLSAGAIRTVTSGTNHASVYADFARFFDRFGLYGEAQVKDTRNRDWSLGSLALASPATDWTPKATLGLQVEFPAWLNGTIRWVSEYHYNGEGFSEAEASTFQTAWDGAKDLGTPASWVPTALWGGGVGLFSRHYGYTGLSGIPLTEKLSASASVLSGLDTGFLMGRADFFLEVDQNLSLDLVLTRFGGLGSRASELLMIPQRTQADLTVTGTF